MQISRRTKITLAQLLGVIDQQVIKVILDKYGLEPYAPFTVIDISEEMKAASDEQLAAVILEVANTGAVLRDSTTPKYKYDAQFKELRKSLLLDGYQIENESVKALDPNYEGKEPVEDALLDELEKSEIDNDDEVKKRILASASDFIKTPSDFNGSLTNIRVALETTIRKSAINKGFVNSNPSGNSWGPSLAYLKLNGFFSEKEEKALAAVYSFISDGAHIPIGFNEEEFVRLGRNICASMCYFAIKKYNAIPVP
jgi:hypothetical protein